MIDLGKRIRMGNRKHSGTSIIVALLLFLVFFSCYPVFCQNCTNSSLNQANDHIARKRYDLARGILGPLTQCSGQLGVDAARLLSIIEKESNCQPILNSARSSLLRRNSEQACGFVRQMEQICPDLPELGGIRSEAGGCKVELPDYGKAFEEAIELEKEKAFSEALSALKEIKARQSDFPGIDAAIGRVQKKLSDQDRPVAAKPEDQKTLAEVRPAQQHVRDSGPGRAASNANPANAESTRESGRPPITPAGNGCAYEHYMNQAQDQNSRNNYYRALEWLQKADACRSGNPAVEHARAEVERAVKFEKAALNDALNKFYGGEYEESHKMLHNLVASGKTSPQGQRLAEYYLAASSLQEYLITGESRQELKSDGFRHYNDYRAIPIDIAIPPTGFSPRLLQILENAANSVHPVP